MKSRLLPRRPGLVLRDRLRRKVTGFMGIEAEWVGPGLPWASEADGLAPGRDQFRRFKTGCVPNRWNVDTRAVALKRRMWSTCGVARSAPQTNPAAR
jgi:hypothetical protein